MNEKEYWDMVANEKKFNTPFQMDLFKKYVDLDKKILDYGCGYGRVLKELYDHGYNNLLGVDFSSEMIHRAKELYPYIDFNLIDGDILDFDDESFDSIVLVAVLNCIHEEEKQMRLMKELYRVLKKDGIIYVNEFLLNQSDMYNDYATKTDDTITVSQKYAQQEMKKLDNILGKQNKHTRNK